MQAIDLTDGSILEAGRAFLESWIGANNMNRWTCMRHDKFHTHESVDSFVGWLLDLAELDVNKRMQGGEYVHSRQANPRNFRVAEEVNALPLHALRDLRKGSTTNRISERDKITSDVDLDLFNANVDHLESSVDLQRHVCHNPSTITAIPNPKPPIESNQHSATKNNNNIKETSDIECAEILIDNLHRANFGNLDSRPSHVTHVQKSLTKNAVKTYDGVSNNYLDVGLEEILNTSVKEEILDEGMESGACEFSNEKQVIPYVDGVDYVNIGRDAGLKLPSRIYNDVVMRSDNSPEAFLLKLTRKIFLSELSHFNWIGKQGYKSLREDARFHAAVEQTKMVFSEIDHPWLTSAPFKLPRSLSDRISTACRGMRRCSKLSRPRRSKCKTSQNGDINCHKTPTVQPAHLNYVLFQQVE